MKWYIPSWNGDLRLEPAPGKPEHTVLTLEKPTADEMRVANEIAGECIKQGWLPKWRAFPFPESETETHVFLVTAPLEKVGPIAAKIMRPGTDVLTAVRLANGEVLTSHGARAELQSLAEQVAKDATNDDTKKPEAAATVKRPTPCCPSCYQAAVGPATDVLLAFLDEEQHADWSRDRLLFAYGGLTGHRYMLAHRNSAMAAKNTRICRDMTDDSVVHFHDWSVPPEEEVLAAKLILEHREPWLRNEATMFGVLEDLGFSGSGLLRFKNPFGGSQDGIPDSEFCWCLGDALSKFEAAIGGRSRS
jgi:hypothetical protein